MSSQLGQWMPKQKDGKNWKVDFTVTTLHNNETVTRTKTFRVREDAQDWVKVIKNRTVEANEVHTPTFSGFTYKVSKITEGKS
jgi:hypothetical protein